MTKQELKNKVVKIMENIDTLEFSIRYMEDLIKSEKTFIRIHEKQLERLEVQMDNNNILNGNWDFFVSINSEEDYKLIEEYSSLQLRLQLKFLNNELIKSQTKMIEMASYFNEYIEIKASNTEMQKLQKKHDSKK